MTVGSSVICQDTPPVVVWDPLTTKVLGDITCPFCQEMLVSTSSWTDGSSSRLNPRQLYDVHQKALLLSRIYRCNTCKLLLLSHDPRILKGATQPTLIPFILSHKCGFTRNLVDLIYSLVQHGMTFFSIESMITEQYWSRQMNRPVVSSDYKQLSSTQSQLGPSNDILTKCFITRFIELEPKYNAAMQNLKANSWIACDHTFKIASNVGYLREGKWVTQYNSAFFVMGDAGQVLAWQLTKGTSSNEISKLLGGIKERHSSLDIQYIAVDNCCQIRDKLKNIFGESVKVILDLFHATQRITRKLPTRHEYFEACNAEFRYVFRSAGDLGSERSMPTAQPAVLRKNIEEWLSKWFKIGGKALITSNVSHEVTNLLGHIDKGCLSEIPVGCGTNRNENLHKLLNTHFHISRIGILLAYALLTVLLYSHNSSLHFKGKAASVPLSLVDCTSTANKCMETFGIVPKTESDNCCSSIQELLLAEMEPPEDLNQGHLDKDLVHNLVRKALWKAGAYIQFKDLSKRNTPEINDWLDSERVRAPTTDDLCLLDENLHRNTLRFNIASWNFRIIQVPADGNCFFSAISISLEEVLKENPNLTSIKIFEQYSETVSEHKTFFLRKLLMEEWLGERRSTYEACYAGENYIEEVNQFQNDGFFDCQLGDTMVSAMCNALGITICLLTSLKHQPVMIFSPEKILQSLPDPVNMYLAYNAHGAGHYDALAYVGSSEKLKSYCRCGVNSKVDSKVFCTSEDKTTKYKSRCPCLKQGIPCRSMCACVQCHNPHGQRPAFDTNVHQRKRSAHIYQGTVPDSKKFALHRREILKLGRWTVLENVVLGLLKKDMEFVDPADALQLFNRVVQEATAVLGSNEDNLCPRSIRSLAAKLQSIESKRKLSFLDLYMMLQEYPDISAKSQP